MSSKSAKRLIIVGGGHASLPLIKMGEKWKKLGIEIILISENPFLVYSGALPQFMGGFYGWKQTAIDLESLSDRYGVTFIKSRVTSVNGTHQTVILEDLTQYRYDYLLLNVGAKTIHFKDLEKAVPVKPMNELISLRQRLENGDIKKLLVAGGGAAGAELALNISHPQSFAYPEITIIDTNSRLLSSFPEKLSDRVTKILKGRNVRVKTGTKFQPSMASQFDATIIAVGNRPGSGSISHGFNTDTNGRLITDQSLQVKEVHAVFAAGDTANVGGHNYSQIGVHAVKQGVILRHNIKALHTGGKLKHYNPYLINPLILSNGPDSAFYILNSFVINGKWAALLKYILDMQWLEKYTKPAEARRNLSSLLRDGLKRASVLRSD